MIRAKVGLHVSLSDELAESLNISSDSAYRRMRMEKKLSVEEVEILCQKYEIALDLTLAAHGNATHFRRVSTEASQFSGFLEGIAADLKTIVSQPGARILYYAKDIPLFHYFPFPEIAAFKLFFWRRSVMGQPSLQKEKFNLFQQSSGIPAHGLQMTELYNAIPSTEIWSAETFLSLLLQIRYYHESGIFAGPRDARILCEKVLDLIRHIENQVAAGSKFLPGKEVQRAAHYFDFYVNEVMLGDNSILVTSETEKRVYLPHHVVNYLVTDEPGFCTETETLLQNLVQRSTLISATGEKARGLFFNELKKRTESLMKELESA
jgi:hypothetical protein